MDSNRSAEWAEIERRMDPVELESFNKLWDLVIRDHCKIEAYEQFRSLDLSGIETSDEVKEDCILDEP